jgi:hypothetical protein
MEVYGSAEPLCGRGRCASGGVVAGLTCGRSGAGSAVMMMPKWPLESAASHHSTTEEHSMSVRTTSSHRRSPEPTKRHQQTTGLLPSGSTRLTSSLVVTIPCRPVPLDRAAKELPDLCRRGDWAGSLIRQDKRGRVPAGDNGRYITGAQRPRRIVPGTAGHCSQSVAQLTPSVIRDPGATPMSLPPVSRPARLRALSCR